MSFKLLLFFWLLAFILLLPYGPVQFSSGGFDFFRGWLFLWLPSFLCCLLWQSKVLSSESAKTPIKFVLIPISALFLIFAFIDAVRGMPQAVTDNKNIFCQPEQVFRFGNKTIATYKAYDLVHEYLEIRQEWQLVPGIKLVRYIDRLEESPPLRITLVKENQIHYDGNDLLVHNTRSLW